MIINVGANQEAKDVKLSAEVAAIYGLTGNNQNVDEALKKIKSVSQVVTITTSQAWTVPDGVTEVIVFAIGGGGGGAGMYNNSPGGGGGYAATKSIKVSPGEAINIVIGAGGAGSASYSGSPGGSTLFGHYIGVLGGNGGGNGVDGGQSGGTGGAGGGYGYGGAGDSGYGFGGNSGLGTLKLYSGAYCMINNTLYGGGGGGAGGAGGAGGGGNGAGLYSTDNGSPGSMPGAGGGGSGINGGCGGAGCHGAVIIGY